MKNASLFFACILMLSFLQVTALPGASAKPVFRLMDEENRPVGSFSGVAAAVPFNVYVTIGAKESLRLEGDRDLLDKIETPVKNGILHLKMQKGSEKWFGSSKKVTIYITAPSLNNLSVSGAGNMEVKGTVKGDRVTTAVSGSGRLTAVVTASSLSSSISGSGGMALEGKTNDAKIEISGSGQFDGEDLNSRAAEISVSGSGKASIRAEETLNAVLSGSGKVTYSGNAQVNVVKSGSGSVTKI
ncbi:head GIN domain-containing protein [Adhaeribacter pallidiroseus]|uniref:Putative auto-transporter adhesin head GIN domain-containing protein n=1 Tax=Adhaeribacter pallidiroseus TaxID=2072847 RepID=A0A369QML4_9BACT|nr:head GIN domain-containing protein [Adhaeribacter pallidiroseus]RDC65592.1 hypothetical protein AHMF7616_04222 [Adhaeribacter pallidiroseus]